MSIHTSPFDDEYNNFSYPDLRDNTKLEDLYPLSLDCDAFSSSISEYYLSSSPQPTPAPVVPADDSTLVPTPGYRDGWEDFLIRTPVAQSTAAYIKAESPMSYAPLTGLSPSPVPLRITSPLPARARHRSFSPVPPLTFGSDTDSDSDDRAKDADYVPEPEWAPSSSERKRRRSVVLYLPAAKKARPAPASPRAAKARARKAARPRPARAMGDFAADLDGEHDAQSPAKQRNTPASPAEAAAICDILHGANSKHCAHVCPVASCDVGRTTVVERAQDFLRHMESHLPRDKRRNPKDLQCWGVPFEDRAKYGIPPVMAPIQLSNGQLRVGGCMQFFSRRDALARHCRNSSGQCFFEVKRKH